MKIASVRAFTFFFWLKDNLAVILVLLGFFLFISKSLYNYPLGIMALIGLYRTIRSPAAILSLPHMKVFIYLFLCLWIPMLCALPDAFSFKASMKTVLPYSRFLFIGVYLISEASGARIHKAIHLGVFCLLAFWCIDALVQFFFETDFFGYPYEKRHITGMFYPKNTIAHICAGLSPLYFELIRQKYKQSPELVLLLFPLFAVILLSGRRAAWIMLAISVSGYLYYFIRTKSNASISPRKVMLIGIALMLSMLAVLTVHEPSARRLKTTMGVFSGDYTTVNEATARRLPLWQTSLYIAKKHWINGVGPRGYRLVYTNFADEDDFWKQSGQTHPHQLILEIFAETGVIGLCGLFLFSFFFYRFVRSSNLDPLVFSWAWAVVVVTFPLNTHMAFYGAYWSSFFWLLVLACFVSVINRPLPAEEA